MKFDISERKIYVHIMRYNLMKPSSCTKVDRRMAMEPRHKACERMGP